MAPYKRETVRKLVSVKIIEEANQTLKAGKSRREVARELGRRMHLAKKIESWHSLDINGTLKERVLTDEIEREMAQHCRDLDSGKCDLTRKHAMKAAFDYADMNGVSSSFNIEKQMTGKD
ncbi:hypothetical protein AVEN_51611-1 [Araneus ventricosus]|uniref:Uncharacterized protein n=1 Tax=Araneus ventricosus TaxID=182803 RepID=A0A4Y2JWU9_ARAVE|nr:hypothetical protein AVEN_51611-1 [Araneus ventricosus]